MTFHPQMVETRVKCCVESGKEVMAEKPAVPHYKGASVNKPVQFKPIYTAINQLKDKERQITKQENGRKHSDRHRSSSGFPLSLDSDGTLSQQHSRGQEQTDKDNQGYSEHDNKELHDVD